MSEERIDQQKMTMYLMGGVIVLLIAIVAILMFQSRATPPAGQITGQPQQGVPQGTAPQGGNPGQPQGGVGGPAAGQAPAAPFDAKTATKVPKGVEPKAFVESYFKAVVAGDFAKAYEMLPADKKAATTAEAFGEQLKSYGMNGYTLGKVQANGDEAVIDATAKTSAGDFGYTWTFVKKDGGWLVKSRTLSGMGN